MSSKHEENDLMAKFMAGDSSICTSFNKAKREDRKDLLLQETIKLRDKGTVPIFGLGTWLSTKNAAKGAVIHSLKIGYRLIDTAQLYENEDEVGDAIEESGKKRTDIFVVTKLDVSNHGAQACRKDLKDSLNRLKLKYVDLFLIHSPKGGKIIETWKMMLELKREGLTRSVGVSNFGVEHLENIRKLNLELPAVNQIEFHVFLQQRRPREYMKKHGIAVMGYCPLARCKMFGKSVTLSKIAKKLNKSEAQICIRWSIQEGVITIPKSTNSSRIEENADVFTWSLGPSDMLELSKLDCGFKASNSVNSMDLPWDKIC